MFNNGFLYFPVIANTINPQVSPHAFDYWVMITMQIWTVTECVAVTLLY